MRTAKRGRPPRRFQPWKGVEAAELRAIEVWGLDAFNGLRSRLGKASQRWGVARDRAGLERFSNVLGDVWPRLSAAIGELADASPSYGHAVRGASFVLAPDELQLVAAATRAREALREALTLTRAVSRRFPRANGETHLEAVAVELVHLERDGRPFSAEEAATLSVACLLEEPPRSDEAFAALRRAWGKRLRAARIRGN